MFLSNRLTTTATWMHNWIIEYFNEIKLSNSSCNIHNTCAIKQACHCRTKKKLKLISVQSGRHTLTAFAFQQMYKIFWMISFQIKWSFFLHAHRISTGIKPSDDPLVLFPFQLFNNISTISHTKWKSSFFLLQTEISLQISLFGIEMESLITDNKLSGWVNSIQLELNIVTLSSFNLPTWTDDSNRKID